MNLNYRKSLVIKLLVVLCLGGAAPAQESDEKESEQASEKAEAKAAARAPAVLWRDPGDITSRNLYYGPGGPERMPKGRLKFLEEELGGTNLKFDVQDEQGVRWRVKPGDEAQSETSATRLLWAVGYFADENYYLPEIRVEGMPKKLNRGQQLVSEDGVIRGVRMERREGLKKIGTWSWGKNPFVDTRELNGLRALMALLNNWDVKTKNNAIYEEEGEHRYVISDMGTAFGRSGHSFSHSRNNLDHYQKAEFIRDTTPDEVDFHMASRPHPLEAIVVPQWIKLRKKAKVVKGIPRADARWIGELLSRLSPEQIRDCFRASGHSPDEVEGFTQAVQERIQALNRL